MVEVGAHEGHAFLRVKDTGIGIPKEHQERVFERFYRVDKSRSKQTGGTGLGLAIVKHVVAIHNASLSLESEEGKGDRDYRHFLIKHRKKQLQFRRGSFAKKFPLFAIFSRLSCKNVCFVLKNLVT